MMRSLSVAMLAGMVLAGCGGSEEAVREASVEPTVSASLSAVTRTSVDGSYEAVGTVRAKASSTIQSKATGHVTAVLAKEGDAVRRGQLLVEIDSREAETQLRRASSALREAREARREVDRSIQAAMHAKGAADAGSELAQATYERYKDLSEQGVVSRQAFDEASAKWKGATADAARAAEMIGSVQARRGEADERIQQAQTEVTHAETVLTYTKVTAPFDGIVTRKTVDVGDLAAPGAPLLEVEATGQYRLEAQVSESFLGRVREGDEVPVVLEALGEEPLPGVVAEIIPSADASSRTFVVKIDLPQTSNVRSGMFGRARFSFPGTESLTVPATAVARRGQLTAVYVVGADRIARMRLVTLGNTVGDRVEVLSGVDEGERVVTERAEQISDGMRVAQG